MKLFIGAYRNSPAMLQKYLGLNNIVGFFVSKDLYSSAWRVYMANSATTGFPDSCCFDTKREAMREALQACELTGLPILKGV